MFIHNFIYSFKYLFRNKALIFWTFAFPIILGTFFQLAFSNISKSEKLDIIEIAIVNDEKFTDMAGIKEAYDSLSDKNDDNRLFNTQYVNIEKAKELLENEEISGYIYVNDNNKLNVVFIDNGINQTIIKYVTEEIEQTANITSNITENEMKKQTTEEIDYESIYKKALSFATEKRAIINNTSNNKLDYVMIEFYTLIAMACLYGGMLSITVINKNLPNISNVGKRLSVSPNNKLTTILSSLLASYATQLIGLLLLFIFTIFVLKVDYGDKLSLVVLLSCVGSLTGLSLGLAIGTLFKINEGAKTGILLAVTMLGCYFAGMMGITMKYIIDKNVPIINKINPASLITDGFYSLYYYDTLNRFWSNITILLIISFVLIILSFISLRRQKYDNI